MRRIGLAVIALLGLMLGIVPAALAQKRVALVVGNSAYQHTSKLSNPKNDATDIVAALKKHGFQIIEGYDLDKAAFDRRVREFAVALKEAEVGVFFYAGHGLQVNNQNYLVPIDAKAEAEEALDFEMLRVEVVQKAMERTTGTNILFLDACRDNPLVRNLARGMGTRSSQIGKGLAAIESGVGTLISFSTHPGAVASDGTGRNSPYAGALARYIASAADDLSAILISVRNDVMKETQRKQVPWEHSALTGKFYFELAKLSDPSQKRYISELFTSGDLQRLKVLAEVKKLPLPAFTIYKPAPSVSGDLRQWIGIWVSDKGYEKSGRQAGLIVEDVSEEGRAFGYSFVGPPTSKSTMLTPTKYYPFLGLITGNKLRVKGQRAEIVAVLDATGNIDKTETWTNGLVGKISLRPFWRLVEVERALKR